MKNILYILFFGLFLSLNSCTGDKGDVGPKGDTGQAGADGANGKVGEKGPTGDKGLTGDSGQQGAVGDKGTQPALSVSYTNWEEIKDFTNVSSDTYISYIYGKGYTDISKILPANFNSSEFSRSENFDIVDTKTGTITGFLYHYIKIIDNKEEVVFREKYNTEKINYSTVFLLSTGKAVSMSLYSAYKKGQFESTYDFAGEFSKKKPAVRYVFVPLNLGARMQNVDMNNYEEVKRVFEIKD